MQSTLQPSAVVTLDKTHVNSSPGQEINSPASFEVPLKTAQFSVLGAYRFFLALVVTCGHISTCITPGDWTSFGLWLNQASATFGFFVINGFAVATSLSHGDKGFVAWRWGRIYPVYIVNLIMALLVSRLIGGDYTWPQGQFAPAPTHIEILGTICMLVQIATTYVALDGQAWCICTDWWMGIIGSYLRRSEVRTIAVIIVTSLVMYKINSMRLGNGPHLWGDGQAIISVLWIWMSGFLYFRFERKLIGALILIVPPAVAATAGCFVGWPLLIAALMLIASSHVKSVPQPFQKIGFWLGDMAIPLYMCHTWIAAYFCKTLTTSSTAIVFASLLMSVILVHCVDYPWRRIVAAKRLSMSRSNK